MIRVEGTGRGRGILIDAKALTDPNLSFRAKGVLAYLQLLPGGAAPDVKSLEGVSVEKRAAIRTALKELLDRGYVARVEPAEGRVAGCPLMDSLFDELPVERRPRRRSDEVEARPGDPKKVAEAERVERIIDHLNALRERSWSWAQYTPFSARYARNVEHIRGRLADGYAEEDLLLVLDYLAATDGGKEESRRYFNCVTPFNTKNFERNLAMAREWAARGRPGVMRKQPGTSRGKAYYLGPREEGR